MLSHRKPARDNACMHWVKYDDYRLPKQIAGHPALEFCNTRASWGNTMTPRDEWLDDFDTFAVWCQYAGLIENSTALRAAGRENPETAQLEITQTRRLRQALYALLTETGNHDCLQIVNQAAQRAAVHSTLMRHAPGDYEWGLASTGVLTAANDAVAQAATRLLCSPDAAKVRACPGDECGWLFIDTRGRRRWCSMESCGNRAKVKAFAQRNRSG